MEQAYGTTRWVLLTRNYAIKLPTLIDWRLFLLGLLANMNERFFYLSFQKGSPELAQRLCPIVFSAPGGWLVVMRRAQPLDRDDFELCAQINWKYIPVERKPDSFGWFEGRIVAIDYGNS